MLIQHLIYFLIGIGQDVLITYYYQTIAKEYALKAAFTSTIVTLLNLIILYKILTGIENQIFTIILAHAVGNGVGTVLVIKKEYLKKLFWKKRT